MTTFLSKLFKPKWQNKHLPTRIDAIKALDANNEEEQSILSEIAKNDTHEDARAAAIQKLNQSTVLVELHKNATPQTQKVIEQRLYELADAQSLTIYDLILDVNLLTEMIVKSNTPDNFIRGLAHIEDSKALLTIAQSSKTSKIRQAAAELIETEEQLQFLTQTAKSKDKSVYQIAKNKLSKIKDFQKEQQHTQERIESILNAIEEHATTENLKLYEAKLTSLQQRWEPLTTKADTLQAQRFETAQTKCATKLNDLVQEQQAIEEESRLAKVGGDEQEATLLTLQDTLEKFRTQAASFQALSALDAIIKTQETRWLEATRHNKVDKTKHKHYQVLMSELRHYLNALKAAKENDEALSELVTEINHSKKSDTRQLNKLIALLNKLLNKIDWPEQFSLPDSLEAAHTALGKSADLKAALAKSAKQASEEIDKLIATLDKALEDRQIKASSHAYKKIQGLISQVDPAQASRVHNQLILRLNQLNDLRDWQGYASVPRQTELCELMEKLADTHLDPQEKANRIKAMQKEWKSLGGATDKALWDRFKAAADKAFEPCKEFFDEQRSLKSTNLERRKTLIEQLKTFLEKTDWNQPDWKLAEQINRKARTDWKEAYPVDFKENKTYQSEFNALLAKLDSNLNEERERNIALKSAIVEKAKKLIDEDNLETAINEAKQLQTEWKSIGITDHKQDRKLWKEFRLSCDQIFARRDQARESRREESEAAFKEGETFCQEVEAFIQESNDASLEILKASLADFRKRFKQLPPVPKNKLETLNKRFESAIKEIKSAIIQAENKTYLEQLNSLKERSKLCRQVYLDKDNADINILDQSFNNTPALPSSLENKTKSLWISVKAGSVHQDFIVDESDARNLCIRCEIAAGIDSPDSDKELRMQLQVSRLSEGMSSQNENLSREDQLKALLEEWYLKVGISSDAFDALESRIDKAVSHLLV